MLLPGGVLLPGFRSGLDFLAERMSLAVGVLFLAMVASSRMPRALTGTMTAIALVFFGMSYRDEAALNRMESKMARAVAELPPGQRVVSALARPGQPHPLHAAPDRPGLHGQVLQLCQL